MRKLKKVFKFLRKYVFKPFIKSALMRLIIFYQRHFSKHTCLYSPTCSEYMLRSLNNFGVIFGIILGTWRLLRRNPLSKGGYDPVPEKFYKKKWVL